MRKSTLTIVIKGIPHKEACSTYLNKMDEPWAEPNRTGQGRDYKKWKSHTLVKHTNSYYSSLAPSKLILVFLNSLHYADQHNDSITGYLETVRMDSRLLSGLLEPTQAFS